jgi:hypothetical protein
MSRYQRFITTEQAETATKMIEILSRSRKRLCVLNTKLTTTDMTTQSHTL